MIEATCAACGMMNRIAEADVPVGAKFVSCTSCKSKVVLPARATAAGPPKMAIPAIPPKLPTPPKGVPSPKPIDLADLPAPKRQSPLAGAEPASRPAPRSALADAELPVPKGAGKPPGPQQPSALDLDDLMAAEPQSAGLADLPAPKRPSPLGDMPAKPAPRSALADLPAPKKPAGITDLPAPKSALSDLPSPRKPGEPAKTATPPRGVPAPARPSGNTDLPMPKTATPPRGLPAHATPARPGGNTDLPMPKAATPPSGAPAVRPGNTDLPMPKAATPSGAPAVRPGPMPKTATPRSAAAKPPAGVTDLPTPKPGLTDLPMPTSGVTGLLTPKGPTRDGLELDDDLDLPMPAAGVTGLLTPKPGTQDIAPKGFFDDLPQPARQGGGIDLPAPKGFFDDLPQPAPASKQGGATQDLAPKGFFDDLPQPAAASKQGGATQDLAPKGLFDDLPHPAKPGSAAAAASTAGLFDDIQQPTAKSPANAALGTGDIDLGPVDGPSLDLEAGGNSGPDLELGLPLDQDQEFQDLDLSEPTAGRPKPVEDGSPIRIKTPSKGGGGKPIPINVPAKPGAGGELKLDLADDPHAQAHTGRPAATAQKITPKRKAEIEADTPEARAAKRRRSRIALGSLLVVVALGAGGFFFYQRHVAAKEKAEAIQRHLNSAQRWMKAEEPRHWDKAASAAEEALELDSTNVRALGLDAEALIAGALDTGIKMDPRILKGRAKIQEALGAGKTGPELERAQAVAAIAAKGQAQRAVELLKAQIGKAPKDGWLHLYMGWAQYAKGDAAEAVKAFDQAIALAPATKLPALYGQGQAKLLLADVAGAQAAFGSILELNKDHVCANIGLIATKPPSKSVEQVAELEAVLQRKDIPVSDPRCVVHAHTLVGDVHRKAGRDDMARQRYRDALKLVQNDVATHNGLAALEMRAGKLQVAVEHIGKALAANPDHPVSQLLQAELHIRDGKLPDAQTTIDKLSARQPPLPTLAQAQLFVVRGKLLKAKGQAEEAIASYVEGAKLAGELDLTPTMEAVKELSELAKKAPDQTKAAEFRNRATQLLQPLEERAKDDAQLCIELGVAYSEAGDPAKAEEFLRRAVALEGDDAEAKLQLAKTLNVQKKYDEAITQLKEAQQLDPKRTDIALELAVTYQTANRHDEAIAAYDKLLALPDVPIIVRVNAGRYFARRGTIDKAAAQAAPILDAEPQNPGGLYLKAEGLIKAGKPEEAVGLLIRASDADPEAQYLDALGRAYEGRIKTDPKFVDAARNAYERATKADPTMFHPWLGVGQMRVANRDWEQAIEPLNSAAKLDPTNAQVMFNMALAYFGLRTSRDDYKKAAAQWFESALKSQSQLSPAERADGWYKLGQTYVDLNPRGDGVGRAIRAWENATSQAEQLEKEMGATATPSWLVRTYYDLGDLYYKVGNFPGQKRMFQRFVDRNPPKGEAQYKRAIYDLGTSLKNY